MMKPIQILMPMGGLGQRFRDKGYNAPKPLIEIQGQAMFLKALASFDAYEGEKRHLFVVRQDAEDKYGLAATIKKLQPDAEIALLQKKYPEARLKLPCSPETILIPTCHW